MRDATGFEVASADDGGVGLNSFLSFTPGADGVFFIDIGTNVGEFSAGDYSLAVTSLAATDVFLTNGSDVYTGGAGERILGGKGADRITLGLGVQAFGEQGNDIIIGNTSGNFITGGIGNDTIIGGAGLNRLRGDAGNDDIIGGSLIDSIRGGTGDDHLDGGAGADGLTGGLGRDLLTGGADDDGFFYLSTAESPRGTAHDVITDFSQSDGDHINLGGIDAKKGGLDNAFKFIGAKHFHGKAGELHALPKAGFVLVEGDVNGDGKADFQIEVHGVATMLAGDFFL